MGISILNMYNFPFFLIYNLNELKRNNYFKKNNCLLYLRNFVINDEFVRLCLAFFLFRIEEIVKYKSTLLQAYKCNESFPWNSKYHEFNFL